MTSTANDAPTIGAPNADTRENGAANRLAYHPALDGLRALAVAAVVGFHLDESGLTGGFLGVDTFFVLSGFLITTLLVYEWRRASGIGLMAFWARRARRLLPAVILLVIAVSIYAAVKVPPTEFTRLRGDGLAGLFYVANWRFVFSEQSYFDTGASPFRHLWSLAIEEQFYLVWPLITLGCLRLGGGRLRVLAIVTALGTVASIALMAALYTAGDPSRAYYGTDTHAHTILIGVLLALVLVNVRAVGAVGRRMFDAIGIVALLAVLSGFAVAQSGSSRLYHGGSAAFAVTVAVLIGSIMLAPRGVLGRLLSFRPFVALGVISYGVYLWHWPVIVYGTEAAVGLSGFALDGLRVALTLVLSIASYLLVERPIRAGLARRWAWVAAPAGLAAGTVAILVGTAGATAPPEFLQPQPPPSSTSSTTLAPPEIGNPTHVVLVGDSVALSLGIGLDDALAARGIQFEATSVPGCGVLRGVTLQENGLPHDWSVACDEAIFPALRTVVDTPPRPDLVLWLASWDAVDRDLDGTRVSLGTARGRAAFTQAVEHASALLTAKGARLMILTLPPPVPGLPPRLPGFDDPVRVHRLNDAYRKGGPTGDGRVTVLDLEAIVCPDGECPVLVSGIELRPDGSHFGPEGAAWVGTGLIDAVLACWRDPLTCDS